MDYYDELQMKLRFYNNSHEIKANKVILGTKVLQYFTHLISVATGEADFYGAEIKLNQETNQYELTKLKGLNVEVHRGIPYIIDVTYDRTYDVLDNKDKKEKSEILSKLMFTKEEQRKIAKRIDYKVKEEMDKSLKDLKAWIEYDKYLEGIGEEQDILYLAELLREAEGTVGDLRYQIEYAFDIDGVRSYNTEDESCNDTDYAKNYLVK